MQWKGNRIFLGNTVLNHMFQGRSVLQVGMRPLIEHNLGVLAAQLGACEIKLIPFGQTSDSDINRFSQAVRQFGAEFSSHPFPEFDIPSVKDVRVSDIVVCDDILRHIDDPYRKLVTLRHLGRRRVIIMTYLLPSVPPAGWDGGEWPIVPGFAAFSGRLRERERAQLLTALSAYGIDASPYELAGPPQFDDHGFVIIPDSWRWVWTEASFEAMLGGVGFSIMNKIGVGEIRGFLYDCT